MFPLSPSKTLSSTAQSCYRADYLGFQTAGRRRKEAGLAARKRKEAGGDQSTWLGFSPQMSGLRRFQFSILGQCESVICLAVITHTFPSQQGHHSPTRHLPPSASFALMGRSRYSSDSYSDEYDSEESFSDASSSDTDRPRRRRRYSDEDDDDYDEYDDSDRSDDSDRGRNDHTLLGGAIKGIILMFRV